VLKQPPKAPASAAPNGLSAGLDCTDIGKSRQASRAIVIAGYHVITSMNFPHNLHITPSVHPSLQLTEDFAEEAQRQTIQDYGIAGRVWYSFVPCNVAQSPQQHRDLPGKPHTHYYSISDLHQNLLLILLFSLRRLLEPYSSLGPEQASWLPHLQVLSISVRIWLLQRISQRYVLYTLFRVRQNRSDGS